MTKIQQFRGNITELDLMTEKRRASQARHSAALGTLMAERDDLRGVHAFADYLDDAVRWSA